MAAVPHAIHPFPAIGFAMRGEAGNCPAAEPASAIFARINSLRPNNSLLAAPPWRAAT